LELIDDDDEDVSVPPDPAAEETDELELIPAPLDATEDAEDEDPA